MTAEQQEQERSFGQYLKETREKLGLTQREVAEKIQATDAYISALENGKKSPPPHATVWALAHVLELDPEELWEVALKERERRAIEKARGRGSRLRAVSPAESAFTQSELSNPLLDPREVDQVTKLIAALRDDPDFRAACLNLYEAFKDESQRDAVMKAVAAFAAFAERPAWEKVAIQRAKKPEKASAQLNGSNHKAEGARCLHLPTLTADPRHSAEN
jgi:transcriptional regulator with XRE-family HTH domain